MEPEELRIRPFLASDAADVIAVIRTCYRGYDQEIELDTLDADLLAIPQVYPPPRSAFWVLADAKHVVGTVAIAGSPGDEARLKRVFLLPDHRGSGHGKRLVLHAAQWARERGYRRLRFWSDELYARAHALYRHLGAQETGARRFLGGRNAAYEREFVWEIG